MKQVIASFFLALVLCISALGQTSELKTTGTDPAHKCADRQLTKRSAAEAAIESSEVGYGMGYCFGVINTASEILQARGEIHLPDGDITFEQVKNYLDAHPEEWQKPASVLVTKALKQAWGPGATK